MEKIREMMVNISHKYNKNINHHQDCFELALYANQKFFCPDIRIIQTPIFNKSQNNEETMYCVFNIDSIYSRPIRRDLFVFDQNEFKNLYIQFLRNLDRHPCSWQNYDITDANRVVYTSIMSVACCYDIWRPSSRKTPGTFFEFQMAAFLMKLMPTAKFSKHIPIARLLQQEGAEELPEPLVAGTNIEATEDDEASSVSTDLVVRAPGQNGGVVVPLKITTRERIVQPFAHQRILDAAFGPGTFLSLIACISETQFDRKTMSVKQICVPGTVKSFQKYLAPVTGLYYCDVPARYNSIDITRILPVRTIGQFFIDIDSLVRCRLGG